MANTFQGVLANIPGLAGYLAGAANDQQMQGGQLQQMSQLNALYQGIQGRQREAAFRQELQGAQTPEARMAVAQKFMGPDALGRSLQDAETKKANMESVAEGRRLAIEAQRESKAAALEQAAQNAAMMHEWRMGQLKSAEERAAEVARHNKAMEGIQGMLATLKGNNQGVSATDIVDPTDPSRMLKIDAKTYRGGGVGSPGVIGIAGKEPTAAKRNEKESQGKELLGAELDNLETYYKQLNDAKAIPSSGRGAMSNVASSLQSSAVGQMGGRIVGTPEQDARNNIQSSRLRLLNAIKNATGMSAQQLNSNAELKIWLDSLTDPSRSYESNVEIINKIRQAFMGGGKSPEVPIPDAPPPGAVRRRN